MSVGNKKSSTLVIIVLVGQISSIQWVFGTGAGDALLNCSSPIEYLVAK